MRDRRPSTPRAPDPPGARPGLPHPKRWTLAGLALIAVAAFGGLLVRRADGDSAGGDQATAAVTAPRPQAGRSGPRRPRAAPRVQVVISLAPRAAPIAIPRSFFGLSTEYWTLPVDERHVTDYRRVLAMLHVPGDGRFLLRIGGDSSDHTIWDPTVRRLAPWAFAVTPGWIARTARVVRENRLRVILDLNFITGTPAQAAAWARAALERFPRGSIVGLEIGNEPDLYDRAVWSENLEHTGFALGALPPAMTAATYTGAYGAYARALAGVAPGVPLLGPALAEPRRDRAWVSALLAAPHPRLGAITVHEYPYTACASPGQADYPTVARLLSPAAADVMAAAVTRDVRLARAASLPVRVTEFNSVTCGGVEDVSNTFATALWAPDSLLEFARAGVASADLHARVFSVNAPFRFTTAGISARPLLYGLILFTRMLGPDSRLVALRAPGAATHRLRAWAVRQGPRMLRVLLINKGPRAVTTRLAVPSAGDATVQRLLAPTAASEGHVTLAGQHLDAGARWVGRRVAEVIPARRGGYVVGVRRESAALVTVQLGARHRIR